MRIETGKIKLFDLKGDLFSAMLQDRRIFVDFYKHIYSKYFDRKLEHHLRFLLLTFKEYFKEHRELPSINFVTTAAQRHYKGKDAEENLERTIQFCQDVYSREPMAGHEIDVMRKELTTFIRNEKFKDGLKKTNELFRKDEIDGAREKMNQALSWNPEVNLGYEITDVEKRYGELEVTTSRMIETPWPWLNDQLGGGVRAKQLTNIVANSSVGKSLMVDQMGFYAWQKGHNVVIISLELDAVQKSIRIDQGFLKSNYANLVSNKQIVIDGYAKYAGRENKLFIREFPAYGANASDIEDYLYALELHEGLHQIDLLIIDYGDLLRPAGIRSDGAYEDQGVVFHQIRALGKAKDFAVISPAQFNRTGMQTSLDSLDESVMADSYKKFMAMDVSIALHNTPEERENNIIWMKMIKNRNGQKNAFKEFYVNYAQMRIEQH